MYMCMYIEFIVIFMCTFIYIHYMNIYIYRNTWKHMQKLSRNRPNPSMPSMPWLQHMSHVQEMVFPTDISHHSPARKPVLSTWCFQRVSCKLSHPNDGDSVPKKMPRCNALYPGAPRFKSLTTRMSRSTRSATTASPRMRPR